MGRRSASSTMLLLILVFIISYLALTSAPYNHNQLLKVPKLQVEKAAIFAYFLFNPGEYAASTLLNQTTRMTVFDFIKDNPGFHFRAISDCLKMPIGVLQYHLGLLVNSGLITVYPDGRYKRYFEAKRFTETEMKTISALRRRVSGLILIALLKKPHIAHKELAKQLNVSSQALSWQMNRLEKMNLVKRNVEALSVKYSLDKEIQGIIHRYAMLQNGAVGRI